MAEEITQNGTKKEIALGELLSKTWQFFSSNIKLILTAVLVVSIPLRLITSFFVTHSFVQIGRDFMTDFTFEINFGAIFGQMVLIAIISLVGMALVSLMIAWVVKTKSEGGQIDFKTAFQKALSRWPQAIVTSLLMGIMLAVLYMLLIVPGIIFSIFWVFALYAVILNNKSGMDALSYSKSVVKGKWWMVFLYIIVVGIIASIVSSVIGKIFGVAGSNYAVTFFRGIVGDITNSFVIVASVLLFLNLESLKAKQS